MKTCPKCNAQNANDASTCKSCGADLNEPITIKNSQFIDDNPRGHMILAIVLSLIAICVLWAKAGFTLDPDVDGYALSNFYIHFITSAVALILIVISAFCLRGALDKKPVPMKSVFALMAVIAAIAILLVDIIALPGTISDFNKSRKLAVFVGGLAGFLRR